MTRVAKDSAGGLSVPISLEMIADQIFRAMRGADFDLTDFSPPLFSTKKKGKNLSQKKGCSSSSPFLNLRFSILFSPLPVVPVVLFLLAGMVAVSPVR